MIGSTARVKVLESQRIAKILMRAILSILFDDFKKYLQIVCSLTDNQLVDYFYGQTLYLKDSHRNEPSPVENP